jgi:iron-sulfur cluster repair protein YtfE (RIC family)
MSTVTEPLRQEHKELFPHVETLREAAEALSDRDSPAFRQKISAAYSFLVEHLIPHATAEDGALYPVVGRAMGAEMATRTMSRDHVEVGRLTEELGRLRQATDSGVVDEAMRNNLRQVLYGLYTLVKVHFAKEEEVYLPLLDEKLDEQAARAMFEAMEAAAVAAKAGQRH